MASTYLTRTIASTGNRKIFTYSTWLKRGNISSYQPFMSDVTDPSNDYFTVSFQSADHLNIYSQLAGPGVINISTNRLFRDTSAWYHIVVEVDTTQATASDRVKIYINGLQETSFSTATYPNQNTDLAINISGETQVVGAGHGLSNTFDGQMAHYHFIDGTSYDASTFGETDATTGIWKPITEPSVTYGTNGFFLKFENSGAFGTDSSGNANNFTVNGTMTQTIDTPSNVFATLNPLVPAGLTYSNGNCTGTGTTGGTETGSSTIGVSTGKWFAEFKVDNSGTNNTMIGISDANQANNTSYLGSQSQQWGYYGNGGKVWNNGSDTVATLSTFTTGDIIGVALDLDNNLIYWYKNGTVQNSGTGISITAPSSTESGSYVFAIGDASGSTTAIFHANFGNGYFGTTQVSSAQNPDDGIGIFEYSVPTGYKALCTKSINAQEYD